MFSFHYDQGCQKAEVKEEGEENTNVTGPVCKEPLSTLKMQ